MSNFLTKKQQYDLEKNGWELIDNESGTAWFGSDFEEGWINKVTELLSLENTDTVMRAYGVDFLVVGYRAVNTEEQLNKYGE